MVASAINEDRFNDSKKSLFIDYLVNVQDWSKLELTDKQTFKELIESLRHVASLEKK